MSSNSQPAAGSWDVASFAVAVPRAAVALRRSANLRTGLVCAAIAAQAKDVKATQVCTVTVAAGSGTVMTLSILGDCRECSSLERTRARAMRP